MKKAFDKFCIAVEFVVIAIALMAFGIVCISFLDILFFGSNWVECLVTGFCVGSIN